jgi:hypothetical protein
MFSGRYKKKVSGEVTASIIRIEFIHHPDDGGSKLLSNVIQYLADYMAQQPRRQPS